MRAHRVPLALLLSLLLGCAADRPRSDAGLADTNGLAGAWRATIDFEEGAFAAIEDLEFLYVFNAGGTMTESSNYDGAPPVPPAYGVWRQAGAREYEAKYTFYATKPPPNFDAIAAGGGWQPAGRGEFIERITISDDGQSFESALTYDGFDQAGNATESGSRARVRGVRIGF